MKKKFVLITSCLIYLTLLSYHAQAGDPLFPNSVVSNDIDFILSADPDAFTGIEFIGREDMEMPGNGNELFDEDTFVFEATFSNGKVIEIWCHSSFETEESAQEYADKLCPCLGKLPFVQRDMLDHVCINTGNHTAFAETQGHFFVLYSENMDDRISTHDLEETVFHESVHASLQDIYEDDTAWIYAQENDPSFVTDYAESLPHLEDMPESALFAYTLITYPGRLSPEIENWLNENIPNRIAFFRTIYPSSTAGLNEGDFKMMTPAYPNPTKDKLTVVLNHVRQDDQIDILSASGILLKSSKINKGENEFNLGSFPKGIYFFRMPNSVTTKIIKH